MAKTDEFGALIDDASEDNDAEDENEGTGAAEPEGKSESDESGDQRYRDLQSKADKAEAEKNKALKELDALKGGKSAQGASPDGAVPPEVREWLSATQDRLRDQLYAEDPRFEKYGLPADSIQGTTPAEMRASAKDLAGTVDKMENSIRSAVQVEHGIAPPPSAGPADKKVSFDKMSSEEFNDYVENALKGL